MESKTIWGLQLCHLLFGVPLVFSCLGFVCGIVFLHLRSYKITSSNSCEQ